MKTYVSPRPGTRMSPIQRVRILLAEREVLGRPLVFVDRPRLSGSAPVHVIGPDEDQPAYTDIVDCLLNRRVRTVCGIDVRRTAQQGTWIGTFPDHLLCRRCHHRFTRHDAAALIFADNTEDRQQQAGSIINGIRIDKRGRS